MIKDTVKYTRRMVDLLKNDFNPQVYNTVVQHYWKLPYLSEERNKCDKMLNELKPQVNENTRRIKQLEDRIFRLKANGNHLTNSRPIASAEEILNKLKY
jgi:hypothetical protein